MTPERVQELKRLVRSPEAPSGMIIMTDELRELVDFYAHWTDTLDAMRSEVVDDFRVEIDPVTGFSRRVRVPRQFKVRR